MLSKNDLSQKYIDLLKKSLVGELNIENECRIVSTMSFMLQNRKFSFADAYHVQRDSEVYRRLKQQKSTGNPIILARHKPDGSVAPAYEMRNFTELAHTMIGMRRMDNIQYCIETVLADDIAGDLIETNRVFEDVLAIVFREGSGTIKRIEIEEIDIGETPRLIFPSRPRNRFELLPGCLLLLAKR